MIVAIVTFTLPQKTTLAEITKTFQGTAPKYRGIPGLLRKNYFMSEDGTRAGGIYVWLLGWTPIASIRRSGKSSLPANTARRPRSSTCTRR